MNFGFVHKMHIKILPLLLIFIMAACSFAGCGISVEPPTEEGRKIEPIPNADMPAPKPGSYMDTIGEALFPDSYDSDSEGEYDVSGDEAILEETGLSGYTEEDLIAGSAVNAGLFAYERLTSSDKRIYNEIYLTLRALADEYELDCDDPEEINRIFLCVMMDHPELFWVSGYVYTRYTRGDVLEAMGFKGTYTMDAPTVAARQLSIDAYVDRCLSQMPELDDYGKIKYVYEYIIKNTDYEIGSADNQNICSVFINGRSVCQGYAKATQYLLNKLRVKTTLVTGTALGQGNHAWNLVYADGAYYYLDTTWGDSNYRSEEGMENVFPAISYDYLCVPGYEIFKTHTPDSPVELPICTSIDDNYYVREGAYFIGVDEEALRNCFNRAYENGQGFVSIKASGVTSYADIRHYLLDEQHVFDLMPGGSGGTINYWENENLLTISFIMK